MSISSRFLLKSTFWAIGTFGLLTAIRLGSNIIVTRFLSPELFGMILIANTFAIGIEETTDVGIGQNLVYHAKGNEPDFYNTAWTLQAIRGFLVWFATIAIAVPVAQLYQYPILALVIPLTGFRSVLLGFTSISRFLAQKRLQTVRANALDAITNFFAYSAFVIIAYFDRTIWAFVLFGLYSSAQFMIASYFLLPDIKLRLRLVKPYALEIMHFGKWLVIASLVSFMSLNFDRAYLAKFVPLAFLGVYGIARSMADLLGMASTYLGKTALFPIVASQSRTGRAELHKQLAPLRAKLLLLAALCVSLAIATADLVVELIYDSRYHDAGWMLSMLIFGSWFSVLANVGEWTLVGLGKPSYNVVSNGLKFAFLVIGLVIGVHLYGIIAGVAVVALVDLFRYIPILVGQKRENFSFATQDLLITLVMISLVVFWEWLRSAYGLGTSFQSLPI
jgi:O-antigen/teichoic acid export membrane protein